MRRRYLLILLATVGLGLARDVRSQMRGGGDVELNEIFNSRTLWRVRTIWQTPEVLLPSGEVVSGGVAHPSPDFWRGNPQVKEAPAADLKILKTDVIRLPAETSEDWMMPGYDDSAWPRVRVPVLENTGSEQWKTLLLRAVFDVPDVSRAGHLALNMKFKGGAVVYVNGKEVIRLFMPVGTVSPVTASESYPMEVYLNTAGLRFTPDPSADIVARMEKRIRRADGLRIPSDKLRKGLNTLAISIHRAPVDSAAMLRRPVASQGTDWAKLGLGELRIIAQPGSCIVPNTGPELDRVTAGAVRPGTGPLKDKGFRVWSHSVLQPVRLNEYPDPYAGATPVRLTGVRNGIFAGQFLVADGEAIRDIKVASSELAGPGAIPATAVKLRYAVPEGEYPNRVFDLLDDAPRPEIPVYPEHGGALQPVWVSVTVPPDAKPGEYAGTLTVSADQRKPVSLPIQLKVIDWTLPAFEQFEAGLDLMESPESLALAYNVELWSEAHMKLLDRLFSLMKPLAAKTLYITGIRRTHLGNEHAQLRWTRDEEGDLVPDFSVVEKYLDAAIRQLGRIPGVVFYVWEPPESQGHKHVSEGDKAVFITAVDAKTGKLSARQGPAWGSAEAREFWKKATDGMTAVLKKRGMESSLLLGVIGDKRPTSVAINDICAGIGPGARWALHSHTGATHWHNYAIGMQSIVDFGQAFDPLAARSYGWANPLWHNSYPRGQLRPSSSLVDHRARFENYLGQGLRGIGRIGADFWPVVRDDPNRPGYAMAGRFPEAAWGQLNMMFGTPGLFGRGREGPAPTTRSEALRENIQEVQARIFVEKAILEDNAGAALGADLFARCRQALDERIRMCLYSRGEGEYWYVGSDWAARNERLFGLAAEVSRALGGRAPKPNLERLGKR